MTVSSIICCLPVNTFAKKIFHSDIGGVNIRRIVMLLSMQYRMHIKKIYPFQGVSMVRFIQFRHPQMDPRRPADRVAFWKGEKDQRGNQYYSRIEQKQQFNYNL